MSTLAEQIAAIQARKRKAPAKGAAPKASTGSPLLTPGAPKPAASKAAPKKPAAKKAPPVDPNDPAGVTDPLTPAKLDAEAAAAVRTRFGGTEKELQGQGRVSDQMQTNLGSWFDQYKADVDKSRQDAATFNQGVQAGLNSTADAAKTADVAAAATPEAAAAANARRLTSGSFADMLASQASSQNNYMADQYRIGGGEAAQQHLDEAARKRSVTDAITDLQGQKGDFETSYRADARAAERKSNLEQAAFGLDAATAKSDADQKAADRKAAADDKAGQLNKYGFTAKQWSALPDSERTKYRDGTNKPKAAPKGYAPGNPDLNKYGYTADEWNALTPSAREKAREGGGKGGPSAADKRADQKRVDDIRTKSSDALTRINKAQGKWESLAGSKVTTGAKDDTGHDKLDKNGQPETRPITDADRVAELVTEGYSKNEIHLMRLIAEGRKWGKQEIAMAHQLGIRVPRKYLSAKDATNDPGSTGNVVSKNGTGDMKTGK